MPYGPYDRAPEDRDSAEGGGFGGRPGGGGNVELWTRPLLPLRSDRELARETQRIARHLPDSWISRSNRRGVVRVSRWPVLQMAFSAVLVAAMFVLFAVFGRWLIDPGWTPASVSAWAVAGAVVGAGLAAALGGFGAAGSYKRRFALLVVGGGRGDKRRGAILHELGHRMQDVIPGLVTREKAFLEAKLKRPVKVYHPVIASVVRMAAENWVDFARAIRRREAPLHGMLNAYAARDPRDGHAFEVFTMGIQAMHYGARHPSDNQFDSQLRPQPDHEAFVRRCLEEL